MKVTLINYTKNMERDIVAATRSCKSELSSADLIEQNKNFGKEGLKKSIQGLKKVKHMTPFEFGEFTFSVDGVSRALTHQYVRHRIAAFLHQSLRSVGPSEQKKEWFVIPPKIVQTGDANLITKYVKHQQESAKKYKHLVKKGIGEEDARMMLPIGIKTNITCKMNARELMQVFFYERCCANSQWEINILAHTQLIAAKVVAPVVFENVGAPCISDGCRDIKACTKTKKVLEDKLKNKSNDESLLKKKASVEKKLEDLKNCLKVEQEKIKVVDETASKLRKDFSKKWLSYLGKDSLEVDLTDVLGFRAPKNLEEEVNQKVGYNINLDYNVYLKLLI